MVLLVQYEVAERLSAKSGSSDRGVLTVALELAGAEAKIVKKIEPGAFYPQPKVDSAILEIVFSPTSTLENFDAVMQVVKAGFSKKRAKLKNALEPKFGSVTSLLADCGIGEAARAEDLTADNWRRLCEAIDRK